MAILICNKGKNILNNGKFLEDTADTLKDGVEQHLKKECLMDAISKDKVYLLEHIYYAKNNGNMKGLIKWEQK